MRITLEDESRIRLEMIGEGFEIASEGASISPYHLLAGSLASCTVLMFDAWAKGSGIDLDPVKVFVSWEMSEERPKGVTSMDMEIRWPGLPAERVSAVERLVGLCPIHTTLKEGTDVSSRIEPS